jgi:hypothetical protein
MESLWSKLRAAARRLAPGLVTVALGTLAVGVGGATVWPMQWCCGHSRFRIQTGPC